MVSRRSLGGMASEFGINSVRASRAAEVALMSKKLDLIHNNLQEKLL